MSVITLRLDEETERALDALTSGGKSRSDAIREAVLLAYQQESAARLRAEAEAAAADPADLAEVRAIRAELDTDGAW